MIIQLNAIKVTQPIGDFYLCKIACRDLWSMAYTDILRIASDGDNLYRGIQRQLNPDKTRKICNYLKSSDATFPNTIIVNVNKKDFINFSDGILSLDKNESTFTIIDGQHRLQGLKDENLQNFEVALSIFVELDLEEQSRIFVTINTEQTKIDPSIGLYQELQSNLYTPRKMVVKIAEMFTIDKSSPWHKMIKLLGRKDELSEDGVLSLKGFASPIIERIYDDEQYHLLRKNIELNDYDHLNIKKGYLWFLYEEKNENTLYKMLFNYFSAMKKVFPRDWGSPRSLLNKTTGYNAFMLLFDDLYSLGISQKTLSEEFFLSQLQHLSYMDGELNSKNFSPSGDRAAKDMYDKLKSKYTSRTSY